jgi:hypothetical protein
MSAAARSACRHAVAGFAASPKSASMPSPEELIRLAAGLDHGLRHRADESIDDEHRVERHSPFRQLRRPAHVDEHADDVAFLAPVRPPVADRVRCVRVGGRSGTTTTSVLGRN